MVVKGESPRSGAKMPYRNSYGGGGAFFNCGAGEGTSGVGQGWGVVCLIVPTLCVGMPQGTLRVPALERDAERPGLHSHAERGNDHEGLTTLALL
ncbi:hypothetical protein BZL43_17340 [Pseudomonas sp. PICF141]|nr:hypothetical protein BZL43_17340 [Pseudomonas sp. PICF141]